MICMDIIVQVSYSTSADISIKKEQSTKYGQAWWSQLEQETAKEKWGLCMWLITIAVIIDNYLSLSLFAFISKILMRGLVTDGLWNLI